MRRLSRLLDLAIFGCFASLENPRSRLNRTAAETTTMTHLLLWRSRLHYFLFLGRLHVTAAAAAVKVNVATCLCLSLCPAAAAAAAAVVVVDVIVVVAVASSAFALYSLCLFLGAAAFVSAVVAAAAAFGSAVLLECQRSWSQGGALGARLGSRTPWASERPRHRGRATTPANALAGVWARAATVTTVCQH
jgi:hypothetical protein